MVLALGEKLEWRRSRHSARAIVHWYDRNCENTSRMSHKPGQFRVHHGEHTHPAISFANLDRLAVVRPAAAGWLNIE